MYPGNHTDSEILSVPRHLKTRPGAPETHLAYITDDEADLLEIYKPDTPHRGPHDVPNYDSWDWEGGSIAEGGGWASGSGSSSEQQDYGSGPNLGGAGSTTDFGGGRPDTYVKPEEYYTDPIPEDIIYDDKIADYSFSTPDVRSSVMDKEAFRKRIAEGGGSGWAAKTNSELLAGAMYKLTNNPNYLNQPIFVPKDVDWNSITEAYNQALKTGNKEIFFEAVEGLEDITAGNPNLEYFDAVSGTGWDDWWRRPTVATGGGPGPGRGVGWSSGRGGGGRGGGYGGGMGGGTPKYGGDFAGENPWGLSHIQRAWINQLRGMNRGGIVSLC